MKRSDKFIEWMKDWFVHETMSDIDGNIQIIRFYPLPTRRVAINVIYFEYDGFHNHLWNFVSLILYGGYREQILNKKDRIRRPLSFGLINYKQFHNLELLTDKSISLMVRGKQKVKYCKYREGNKIINEYKYWRQKGYSTVDILNAMQGHYPRKWKLPKPLKKIVDGYINAVDREKHKKKATDE
jgi:hypothetical protein